MILGPRFFLLGTRLPSLYSPSLRQNLPSHLSSWSHTHHPGLSHDKGNKSLDGIPLTALILTAGKAGVHIGRC